MGNNIFGYFGINRKIDVRVVMLGLDAAGKTTILYKMKLGEVVTTIPTIGFNVETIKYKNINFTAWDVGGRDKIRPLYRFYFANTQALMYVIDSNDRERINEAKDELHRLLNEHDLKDAVVAVLANKQDIAGAMSVDEVNKLIEFDQIKQKSKRILPTTAITGDGLSDVFEFIADALNGTEHKKTETQAENITAIDNQTSKIDSLSWLYEVVKTRFFKSIN